MNKLLMGLPRSGKSYHAVIEILGALKRGRVVCTNLALSEEKINKMDLPGVLIFLTPEQCRTGSFFLEHPGAFIVLDEVRKILPSGLMQKDLPRGLDLMLSEHGHYEDWRGRSGEVVLISQCGSQLPRCVRTLIDQSVVFQKLNKLGMQKAFVARTYHGAQELMELKKGAEVTSSRGTYKPEIFSLYESHSQVKGKYGGFAEEGDRGSGNILTGFAFKAVGVSVVLAVLGLVYFLSWGDSEPENETGNGKAIGEPAREASPVYRAATRDGPQSVAPGPSEVSGYWIAGKRCGAWDVNGEPLVVEECSSLRGRRSVPRLARIQPVSSGLTSVIGGL